MSNRHDRYWAAQRVTLTPRTTGRSALVERRGRCSKHGRTFLVGVAFGLALGLGWAHYADAHPYEGPDETHARIFVAEQDAARIQHCSSRAKLAVSIVDARDAGVSLRKTREAMERTAQRLGQPRDLILSVLARAWMQPSKDDALQHEFHVCMQEVSS